jgi:hypothetical protein
VLLISILSRECLSFSSPPLSDRLWDPLSLLSNWYRGLFLQELKRSGRKADHSPPSNDGPKNPWNYTSTPPNIFIVWCLIKHTIQFNGLVLSQTSEQYYLPSLMHPRQLHQISLYELFMPWVIPVFLKPQHLVRPPWWYRLRHNSINMTSGLTTPL